jgi:hypothetical protein
MHRLQLLINKGSQFLERGQSLGKGFFGALLENRLPD